MIRVTLELVSARTGETTVLAWGTIHNLGTGTAARGNYWARFSRRNQPGNLWRETDVEGFPRRRLGPWDLLYRALREVVGDRNKETER